MLLRSAVAILVLCRRRFFLSASSQIYRSEYFARTIDINLKPWYSDPNVFKGKNKFPIFTFSLETSFNLENL